MQNMNETSTATVLTDCAHAHAGDASLGTYEQNVTTARRLHAAGWTVKSIASMLHMPYVRTRWIVKGLDGIKPRCASCGTMTTRVNELLALAMCANCEEGAKLDAQ